MTNGFVGMPAGRIEDSPRRSPSVCPLVRQDPLTDEQMIRSLYLLSLQTTLIPNLTKARPTFLISLMSIHTHFALNDQLHHSPVGPPSRQILILRLILMMMLLPCPHSPPTFLHKAFGVDLKISQANLHHKERLVYRLTQNCSHPWKRMGKQMKEC